MIEVKMDKKPPQDGLDIYDFTVRVGALLFKSQMQLGSDLNIPTDAVERMAAEKIRMDLAEYSEELQSASKLSTVTKTSTGFNIS